MPKALDKWLILGGISIAALAAVCFLFAYYSFHSPSEPDTPPPETGIVAEAIDDLTIRLKSGHRIRYIGLEAPEKGKCYSGKALEGNINLIGKKVRLEKEPLLERSVDGAWTRYVFAMENEKKNAASSKTPSDKKKKKPKEILINNRILEMGLAFPFLSPEMKYYRMMASSVRYASATGKGLWSRCEVYNDKTTGRLRTKDK